MGIEDVEETAVHADDDDWEDDDELLEVLVSSFLLFSLLSSSFLLNSLSVSVRSFAMSVEAVVVLPQKAATAAVAAKVCMTLTSVRAGFQKRCVLATTNCCPVARKRNLAITKE